ncbi:histone-lysine N-methyltransferase SETMAR [Trichonephila clavipes]|uniref:Histone-lysine N-methyltransferase SETMAR n=1 Tax=Trichonephila clavipes TaxID=2585209 RepID=A0A8X6RNP3_TRICX|nr:histone-lysine N-methyltransferase SETMAR [Trichonephila clavipes]
MVQHVKRERPLLRNGFLLHHGNARPHIVHSVQNVSQQNNVDILPHPSYSPDLTPCDFLLFPQLKKPLRGKKPFCKQQSMCRFTKEGNRERHVLFREIRNSHPKSMAQTRVPTSIRNCCFNKCHKELHWLGFRARAATHKPLIAKSNHAARLRQCKALQNWTLT